MMERTEIRARMRRALSLVASTALIVPAAAWAQGGAGDAAGTGTAAGGQLGDIVVTARKRAESLQTVPDSIKALDARALETRAITRIEGVVQNTSNLFMVQDQDPSTNVITVRGITTNRNQPGSVAVVIDDVTLPDSDGFNRELFDIERIEVLKGPQGALYGKGAIGGVINIITRKPGNTLEGQVVGEVGNGGLWSVRASLMGPLVPDQVLFSLSGSHRDFGGLIRNTTLDKPVDYLRNDDIRGRLVITPGGADGLSIDLRGGYSDERGGAAFYSLTNLLGVVPDGAVKPRYLENPQSDFEGSETRKLTDLSAKIDLAKDWGTLTAITGYNRIRKFFEGDLDLLPLPLIQPASQKLGLEAWSQELRFTSPSERSFRYIVGAYYQHTNRKFAQAIDAFDLGYFGFVPGLPIRVPSGAYAAFPAVETTGIFDQWAVFSQFDGDLGGGTSVTVALRYDREKRKQIASGASESASFDQFQPKISVKHQFTPDAMVYASYSQGFKSGGFNPPPELFPLRNVDFDLIVRPERTKNVEVGFKSEWLDRRLRINGSVFATDYRNLQIFAFDPFAGQVTVNANKVRIWGAELEAVARLADGLTIDGSVGYTHSRTRDYDGSGVNDGNTPPNTPSWTANLGAEYARDIGAARLTARLDYHYVSKFYWQIGNLLHTPAYAFFDARVAVAFGGVEVALFGKNLTNRRWAVGGNDRTISPSTLGVIGADNYTLNKPRQYGAQVKFKF